MTTTTKDDIPKKVLIHSYNKSSNLYLVSYADEEDAAAVAAIMPQIAALGPGNEDNDDIFFDATEEDEVDNFDDANLDPAAATKKEPLVLLSYRPDQLNPAHGAKFYPLLLELMKRGDQAAAQVEGLYVQNKDQIHKVAGVVQQSTQDVSAKVLGQTQELWDQNTGGKDTKQLVDSTTEAAESAADQAVSTLKSQVEEHAPSEEQVQKIMTMLKDEELTVLLENGKERLNQLVQTDISQATQTALDALGIQWKQVATEKDKALEETQQKALAAVEDLLQSIQQAAKAQGIDIPEDQLSLKNLNLNMLESQFKELHLDQKFQNMFDSFVEASKSDRHLSGIMDDVTKYTT